MRYCCGSRNVNSGHPASGFACSLCLFLFVQALLRKPQLRVYRNCSKQTYSFRCSSAPFIGRPLPSIGAPSGTRPALCSTRSAKLRNCLLCLQFRFFVAKPPASHAHFAFFFSVQALLRRPRTSRPSAAQSWARSHVFVCRSLRLRKLRMLTLPARKKKTVNFTVFFTIRFSKIILYRRARCATAEAT